MVRLKLKKYYGKTYTARTHRQVLSPSHAQAQTYTTTTTTTIANAYTYTPTIATNKCTHSHTKEKLTSTNLLTHAQQQHQLLWATDIPEWNPHRPCSHRTPTQVVLFSVSIPTQAHRETSDKCHDIVMCVCVRMRTFADVWTTRRECVRVRYNTVVLFSASAPTQGAQRKCKTRAARMILLSRVCVCACVCACACAHIYVCVRVLKRACEISCTYVHAQDCVCCECVRVHAWNQRYSLKKQHCYYQ